MASQPMTCEQHRQQVKYFCAAEACYYLPLCDQCRNQHEHVHNKLETIPLKKAFLIAEANIKRQLTQIQRLIGPFKTRQFLGKEIARQKADLQRQKLRLIQIITEKIDAQIRLLETSNNTVFNKDQQHLKKQLELKSQQIQSLGSPHFYNKTTMLRKALNYQVTYFLEQIISKNNQSLNKIHNNVNNSNKFRVYQNTHHQIMISPLDLKEKSQEKSKQVKRIMNQSPLYFIIDQNKSSSKILYSLSPQKKKMYTYNIEMDTWSVSHSPIQILKQGTGVHDYKKNRYIWIGGVVSSQKMIKQNSRQFGNKGGNVQRSNKILVYEPGLGQNGWRYLKCSLTIPRSSCQAVIIQDKDEATNYGIIVAGGIGSNGQILKSTEFIDLCNQNTFELEQTNFGAFSGTLVVYNKSNVLRIGGLYKNKADYSVVEVVERLDCLEYLQTNKTPKWGYVELAVPEFNRSETPTLFHANQAAIQINPNEIFVFGGVTSGMKGTADSYIIGVEQFDVESRGVKLNENRFSNENSKKQKLVKQYKFTVRWFNEKPLITGDDFGSQNPMLWKGKLHVLQNMGNNELVSQQKRLLQFNMYEWSEIEEVLPE